LDNQIDEAARSAPSRGVGCGLVSVLLVGGIYIAIASLIFHLVQWGLEQSVFEGSLPIADVRWLAALIYAAALLIPFALLAFLVKDRVVKNIATLWSLAALIALAFFPARFLPVTAAQAVNLYQIIVLLITSGVLLLWARDGVSRSFPGRLFPLGLAAGLVLMLPWGLTGAPGSIMDTVLNLLAAILFGVTAGLLMEKVLLKDAEKEGGITYIPASLAFGLALIILSSGFLMNGLQWAVAVLSILLAFPAVALASGGHTGSWRAAATIIGLAVSAPMLFVDPDEMAMVITSGVGELNDLVLGMLFRTILIEIGLVILFWVLRGWFARPVEEQDGLSPLWVAPLAALAVAVVGVILFGQPGFYGERIFVIMKDQADLEGLQNISDPVERRGQVFETLVSFADSDQTDIRAELDQLGVDYQPYYLVNGLEVNAGPLVRILLARRDDVDRVLDSPHMRPLKKPLEPADGFAGKPASPEWNLTMIHAPEVWALGVTGEGILVGGSDTGVQGDHPELWDGYRGSRDNGDGNDYNWLDPWYNSPSPTDIGGHGTHTMGSVLGNSVGVAPDAQWIGCVNLGRNLGNPAYYLECWQFLLAPYPQNGDSFADGEPEQGAQIFTNSWGCPVVEGCDPGTFTQAVKALRAAGVFVVVSAGNSGYSGCGSVDSPPAIYDEVYSVGAVTSQKQLAAFSSIGPVMVDGSQRMKPDIVAPGEGVLSAYPNSTYSIAGGTSMAGPHVAGVVALMWSANPDLIGDIDATEEILNSTTQQAFAGTPGEARIACQGEVAGQSNLIGYGLVDALAAVEAAMNR